MGNISPAPLETSHTPAPLPGDLLELERAIKGAIHLPGTESYTAQRLDVWNKASRGYPSAIVSPVCPEDVSAVLNYVAKNKVSIAIAGGRHSNMCMVNDSLVLEMSNFNTVKVDTDTNVVEVGAGVKLCQMDAECSKYGIAVPAGTHPDTGIAGLTLSGGFGHLSRQHGLTIDSLLAVDIVLPNGDIVVANNSENSDLLWALKGGGGNFGVVLKFIFQAYPIPLTVLAGSAVYLDLPIVSGNILPAPLDVLKRAVKYFSTSPKEVSGLLVITGGPFVAMFGHSGNLEEGERELEKFKQIGYTPINNLVPTTYHFGLQQLTVSPNSERDYSCEKSVLIGEITEEFLETLWKLRSTPTPHPSVKIVMVMFQVGPGALNAKEKSETAFWNRDVNWWCLIVCSFTPTFGVESEKIAQKLVRDIQKQLVKFAISSYVAVSDADDQSRLSIIYGDNLVKLQAIKKKYDPENLFHINRNI